MSRGFKWALFLTLVVFLHVATWLPYAGYSASLRWVMLFMLVLTAMSAPKNEKTEFAGTGMKVFAFAFALLAVFSSAWSHVRPMYTLERGLSVLLLAAFLVLALWPRLKRGRDYLTLVNVIAAAAWVMTLASLIVQAAGHRSSSRWTTGAFQGVFGNPNTLGMVYAIFLPVLLARFYYKKNFWNLLIVILSAIMVYRSQSRAGWAGAFLGCCAFYAGYYGRKLWIAVLVLFIAMAVAVFVRDLGAAQNVPEGGRSAFQEALLRGEKDTSEYGSGRIPLWLGALEKWKERPFLGYGFGTAGDTYYSGIGEPARFHSSFIQITAELGIVGFFFFMAPIVYSAYKAARTHVTASTDAKVRLVVAGLTAGWFGGVADCLFESWLFSAGNVTSMFAWMCFLAAMKGMSEMQTLSMENQCAK